MADEHTLCRGCGYPACDHGHPRSARYDPEQVCPCCGAAPTVGRWSRTDDLERRVTLLEADLARMRAAFVR